MTRRRACALLLAAALAVSGCGGSDDETEQPASTPEATKSPDRSYGY